MKTPEEYVRFAYELIRLSTDSKDPAALARAANVAIQDGTKRHGKQAMAQAEQKVLRELVFPCKL